jgi:transcriptional regulator with XRE-family HTH domain
MSSTGRDFVSDDGNGLGRAIASLREERGWKRKDLVSAASISYPFLAEVENGNKRPSMAKLGDIAAAFGMTPGALMERARENAERFGSATYDGARVVDPSMQLEAHPPPSGASMATAPARESSEVDAITSAVMNALEPRLRELVELEVRRQLDRQRGTQW